MMAWCYWHGGRIADARAIIDVAAPSPETEAIRYLLALVDGEVADGAALHPTLSGGPLDALVMRVHYAHGRLPRLESTPTSRWAAAVSAPWRISTLRATGHTEQALDLYEAQGSASWAAVWLHAIVGVEILIDLRRIDDARRALLRARELIGASESQVYDMLSLVMEAKLELRLRRDAGAARARPRGPRAPPRSARVRLHRRADRHLDRLRRPARRRWRRRAAAPARGHRADARRRPHPRAAHRRRLPGRGRVAPRRRGRGRPRRRPGARRGRQAGLQPPLPAGPRRLPRRRRAPHRRRARDAVAVARPRACAARPGRDRRPTRRAAARARGVRAQGARR